MRKQEHGPRVYLQQKVTVSMDVTGVLLTFGLMLRTRVLKTANVMKTVVGRLKSVV
jgi:cobalamin-dependent methionine synthase I